MCLSLKNFTLTKQTPVELEPTPTHARNVSPLCTDEPSRPVETAGSLAIPVRSPPPPPPPSRKYYPLPHHAPTNSPYASPTVLPGQRRRRRPDPSLR